MDLIISNQIEKSKNFLLNKKNEKNMREWKWKNMKK